MTFELWMTFDWIGKSKTIKLGVIHYNSRAIRFYEKLGFVYAGIITWIH